jgi:hypothetical protein
VVVARLRAALDAAKERLATAGAGAVPDEIAEGAITMRYGEAEGEGGDTQISSTD